MLKLTSLGLALIAVVLTAPTSQAGTLENQHQSTSERANRKIQTRKLVPVKDSFSFGPKVTKELNSTTISSYSQTELTNETKAPSNPIECNRLLTESNRAYRDNERADPKILEQQNNLFGSNNDSYPNSVGSTTCTASFPIYNAPNSGGSGGITINADGTRTIFGSFPIGGGN